MKKLLALALIFVFTLTLGTVALAAQEPDAGYIGDSGDFNSNKAETDVYLIAGDEAVENLAATVPLKVVLAVKNDNTIVAPTNYEIANTGAIKFYVSAVAVELVEGYTFNTVAGDNTLNLTLNGDTLATTTNLTLANWVVLSGDALNLMFAGSVGNIQADITSETQVFTITYTLTAGTPAVG